MDKQAYSFVSSYFSFKQNIMCPLKGRQLQSSDFQIIKPKPALTSEDPYIILFMYGIALITQTMPKDKQKTTTEAMGIDINESYDKGPYPAN